MALMAFRSAWQDAVSPLKANIRDLFRDEVATYLTLAELRTKDTGATRLVLVGGAPFLYDSADTTSADDGFAVLVSNDGGRYKRLGISREVLTANRTYFVRTDGNDNNSGLVNTSSGAKQTIASALSAAAAVDNGVYSVTISVGPGVFPEQVTLPRMSGSGTCALSGAGTGVTTFAGATTAAFSDWTVNNITASGGAYGVQASAHSVLRFSAIEFHTCTSAHIGCREACSAIISTGNYSITGNSPFHFIADGNASSIFAFGRTATLSSTPAFSSFFAYASSASAIIAASMNFAGTGATGTLFYVNMNSLIQVNGAGTGFFPGSVAGTEDTATGGLYK